MAPPQSARELTLVTNGVNTMNPSKTSVVRFTTGLLQLVLLCGAVIFLINGALTPEKSNAQISGERVIENLVPRHVPIKIKIREDKEKALKDMNNDKWTSDLELEVTNTSDKPIYLLELWVEMPEVISENGRRMGFTLRFGRSDFIDFDARARPDDSTIQPKQIHVFKIDERFQKGWAAYKTRAHKADPKRIEITFTQLSFGDGSGFNGSDAKPYPYVRDKESVGSCPGTRQPFDRFAKQINSTIDFPHSLADFLSSQKPAEFHNAAFFLI